MSLKNWKPKPADVSYQMTGKKDQLPCKDCGNKPKVMRCAIAEQTSPMRGDDEVTFLCVPCAVKRKIDLPSIACRLLYLAMTQEERETIAERLR